MSRNSVPSEIVMQMDLPNQVRACDLVKSTGETIGRVQQALKRRGFRSGIKIKNISYWVRDDVETVLPMRGLFEDDDQVYSPYLNMYDHEIYDKKIEYKKNNGVVCEGKLCDDWDEARDLSESDFGCSDYDQFEPRSLSEITGNLRSYFDYLRDYRLGRITEKNNRYLQARICNIMMLWCREKSIAMTRDDINELLKIELTDEDWCLVSYYWPKSYNDDFSMDYIITRKADPTYSWASAVKKGYTYRVHSKSVLGKPKKKEEPPFDSLPIPKPDMWPKWNDSLTGMDFSGLFSTGESSYQKEARAIKKSTEQMEAMQGIAVYVWECIRLWDSAGALPTGEDRDFEIADKLSQLTGDTVGMDIIRLYFGPVAVRLK